MFCPKCGTKALDGAEFCQKCGAKLIVDIPVEQLAETSRTNSPQQRANAPTASPKKSKKFSIVLGAIVGFFILLIIIFAIVGGNHSQTTKDPSASSRNPNGVNLSETYTNKEEGISFQYPSAWVPLSEDDLAQYADSAESDYPLVLLANEIEDLPEENSYIMVSKFDVSQDVINQIFGDDEQFATTFNDEVTVKDTSITEIDSVPARKITYITSDGIGYQCYFYAVGFTVYRIDFSWLGENSGSNQRFFDAIINSYTITASASPIKPETGIPSETKAGLLFRGIPADQLIGASYDDMIRTFGEPDSTLYGGEENVYGGATIFFDMWSWENPYLCGISSGSLEDFTYNGHPLSDNYDELSQLLGREPDDARVFYDTYSMTYNWDYMGSQAFLTVDTPATEDSDAAIEVRLSWWYTEEDNVPANNLPVLPDGFEWVEEPSWATKSYGAYVNQKMITGVIKNTSGNTKSYVQIMFNLYDSNGYQIGQAVGNITNFGAGGSWKFEALPMGASGTIASFEFASLSSW